MNVEELYEYCLSLKETKECFPFDKDTLVLKIRGKMFALIPLDKPELQISLKCDPEKAIELRERYACVEPAYHFNKKRGKKQTCNYLKTGRLFSRHCEERSDVAIDEASESRGKLV